MTYLYLYLTIVAAYISASVIVSVANFYLQRRLSKKYATQVEELLKEMKEMYQDTETDMNNKNTTKFH